MKRPQFSIAWREQYAVSTSSVAAAVRELSALAWAAGKLVVFLGRRLCVVAGSKWFGGGAEGRGRGWERHPQVVVCPFLCVVAPRLTGK